MQRQVETWRQARITDEQAKLILYAAFVDGKLDAARSLLSEVHRHYFSLLIIVVSFLPVFLLEAQEGSMFRPLA